MSDDDFASTFIAAKLEDEFYRGRVEDDIYTKCVALMMKHAPDNVADVQIALDGPYNGREAALLADLTKKYEKVSSDDDDHVAALRKLEESIHELKEMVYGATFRFRRFVEDHPEKCTLSFRLELEGLMCRIHTAESDATGIRSRRDAAKHFTAVSALSAKLASLKASVGHQASQDMQAQRAIDRHMAATTDCATHRPKSALYPKPHMPCYVPGSVGSLGGVPRNAFHATSMLQFLANREFWQHLVLQSRHASRCFQAGGGWDASKALVLRASHDPGHAVSVSPEFLRDFVYGWARAYPDTITVCCGEDIVVEFRASPMFWQFVTSRYEEGMEKILAERGPMCSFDCVATCNEGRGSEKGLRMTHELWTCLVATWELEYCKN